MRKCENGRRGVSWRKHMAWVVLAAVLAAAAGCCMCAEERYTSPRRTAAGEIIVE